MSSVRADGLRLTMSVAFHTQHTVYANAFLTRDVSKRPLILLLLILRWYYNPMQTFATLMDFSQSAPLFDLSFQSLILNLLIPVCTQFHHLFLVVNMKHTGAKLVAHLLSDDHKQNRLFVCKAPQDRVKKRRNFFSKDIIVHTGENPAKGTKIRRYRRQIIFPMDADVFGKEYVPYKGKLEDFCPIRAEYITS